MKNNIHRQLFFDNQVHQKSWKETMSGKNEKLVINLLENMGYKQDVDYFAQYPIEPFVLDFAFPNLRLCIEIDGEYHDTERQIKKDLDRDFYLTLNKWIVLRIKEKDLFGEKGSFYKSLMKVIIEDLTVKYNNGTIFDVDFSKYMYEN